MDGQPLRYHRTVDGHFVLYSVGLDCEDNQGLLRTPAEARARLQSGLNLTDGTDIVWPRPATPFEVEMARLATLASARL